MANLCRNKASIFFKSKKRAIALSKGIKTPKVNKIIASVYSLPEKSKIMREKIENSELKNQNSSMVAIGNEAPKKRNIISKLVKNFINSLFNLFIYKNSC